MMTFLDLEVTVRFRTPSSASFNLVRAMPLDVLSPSLPKQAARIVVGTIDLHYPVEGRIGACLHIVLWREVPGSYEADQFHHHVMVLLESVGIPRTVTCSYRVTWGGQSTGEIFPEENAAGEFLRTSVKEVLDPKDLR